MGICVILYVLATFIALVCGIVIVAYALVASIPLLPFIALLWVSLKIVDIISPEEDKLIFK